MNVLNLKLLHIAGAAQISANAINNHGQAVGQYVDVNGIAHGFVYQEESFSQLDYPKSTGTILLGINNLGQIVGMFTTLTGTFGFLYDRGSFSPPLSFPGAANLAIAYSINDRGEIAGVYQDAASVEHGFIYKAGRFLALAYPAATSTSAQGIDDSGQVIGSFADVKGTHGFVYLENAGVFSPPMDHAGASVTVLRGINNGGQITGGFVDAQGNEHPFVYTAGTQNPVIIPNSLSTSLNGINDHGRIVGNARSAAGSTSFIATLPL